MADEQQQGGKSILSQVQSELTKAKRESVKGRVKKLMEDWVKANDTCKKIEQEIADTIAEVGESANVAEVLGG